MPPSRSRTRSRTRRVLARFKSPLDVALAARIMAWACVLPALKRTVSLRSLVRLVRREPRAQARDARREEQIVTFARWACRITRWKSGGNCLERGLVSYRYLCAANAEPVLVVGIARDDSSGVKGHAWVLLDGKPAGESAHAVSEFAVMLMFTPDGQPVTLPASHAAPTR
jgi:hypothetical protein